jgi:peroxiredoxin
VVFWASWCAPCRHEADAVARFARSAAGRGRVVGVAWSDERWSARAFVEEHQWRFPVLFDAHGAVGDRYGIRGLPTTFVLDARGRIVRTLQGPQTAADLADAVREART